MDIEDLKVDFNAVLTSGGGSLTERQFLVDFKSLIGKLIPFKELGHPNLRSLLTSLGGFYFTTSKGETVIHSQGDEKTAHIASLIARQKRKPGKPKAPRARRSNYSYNRPTKPPPLRFVEVRRRPAPSTVFSGIQRQPPPPKFGNPPIIPQRQPLVSAQNRLDLPRTFAPPSEQAQERGASVSPPPLEKKLERGAGINIPEAQNKILNEKSDIQTRPSGSNPKVPTYVEEAVDDTQYIDIQWLQARVQRPRPTSNITPTPQTRSMSNNLTMNLADPATSQATVNEQTVVFKSSVDELTSLASKLGMSAPSFSEIQRRPSRGRPLFLSKVKIGDVMYSSYPEERGTSVEAMELVASLACEDLRKRLSKLTTGMIEPQLADGEIVERVYKIVKQKVNGIFDQAVVTAYEESHGSCIPTSWLDVVQRCTHKFSIENFNDTRTIIYPISDVQETNGFHSAVGQSAAFAAPSPAVVVKCNGDASSSTNLRLYKDINCNTVTLAGPRTLPPILFPNSNTVDVFVASVGAENVWVRIIGDDYDLKYHDVMTELELDMLTHDEMVSQPIVDEYYVINSDSSFIRVQLKKIHPDNECEVFLIDNGEMDTIPIGDLRVLSSKYMCLPAQAVQCRLSYLDISYEKAQSYITNEVIGKSYVAEVIKLPSADTNFANIILFNTEDEKQGPININNKILEEIAKNMDAPIIPQRHVAFVKITCAEPSQICCQVEGKDLKFLQQLLLEIYENQDLVEAHGLNAHPRVGAKSQQLFLCKYGKTWRRGTIMNWDDPRNPTINFIDYGVKEKVMLSDIFNVDEVLPPLKMIPAQAVKVNLWNLPPSKLNVGVINRLVALAPPNMSILAKCVTTANCGGQPEVELFKRVEPDNMIASINTDLIFNYEEYSKRTEQKPVTSTSSSFRETRPPGSTTLKKYPLPSIESEFFDVTVSMSSSPSNFVVQPLQNRLAFDTMMKELQVLYEAQHSVMPSPAIEEFTENAAFAAKHPDDLTWYRVSVVTALSEDMVSVRYVDYGDIGLIPVDRVRYLDPKFSVIPALAIRAKLHGVKPKEKDWTVSQCAHFTEIVDCKSFVSKVMDVNAESISNSWQLSLKLIDTTAENVDVDIGELLVKEEMADTD